jgi:selenocysteine lyase/cysteine desulfurase
LAGTTAAIDFVADVAGSGTSKDRRVRLETAMRLIGAHEDRLLVRIEAALGDLEGIIVRSRARRRTPTLLLTFENRAADDAYRFLAERGVNAPAGTFYAYEPSLRLGLGTIGGLRIGLAPYNNDNDVDRLIEGLSEFVSG